jgi:hypothetical protein
LSGCPLDELIGAAADQHHDAANDEEQVCKTGSHVGLESKWGV